jgi:hypothetical protein
VNTSTIRYPHVTDSQVMNGWLRIGGAEGRSTHVRLADIEVWESEAKADLIRIYTSQVQLDIRPDKSLPADERTDHMDPMDQLFELLVTHLLEATGAPDRPDVVR